VPRGADWVKAGPDVAAEITAGLIKRLKAREVESVDECRKHVRQLLRGKLLPVLEAFSSNCYSIHTLQQFAHQQLLQELVIDDALQPQTAMNTMLAHLALPLLHHREVHTTTAKKAMALEIEEVSTALAAERPLLMASRCIFPTLLTIVLATCIWKFVRK